MTKTQLVEQMAKNAGIPRSAANKAVNSFIDCVKVSLKKKDGKITLAWFGHVLQVPSKGQKRCQSCYG